MILELAAEYLTFDYNAVSETLRNALPRDLILFVILVVAIWLFVAVVLLKVLKHFLSDDRIETVRKLFKFAAVVFGGLGVVLFVLDSRASSVVVDFSVESSTFEERSDAIWRGLELAQNYCDPGPLQELSTTKDDLSREMVLCSWQNEVAVARNRVQSLRLEPVAWTRAEVDLNASTEPDYDALRADYEKQFINAHASIQALADDYIQFAENLGIATDVALDVLRDFDEQILEASIANSGAVVAAAKQLWSDEALRRLRSATIFFLTILAAGMALELALLLTPEQVGPKKARKETSKSTTPPENAEEST